MALTIKKSSWVPGANTNAASPLQKSLWARIWIADKTLNSKSDSKFSTDELNKNFYIVLSEPLELQIETEWKESGGAEIAKQLDKIFNSKAIKALAGSKASNHAPNNEWSQKTTEIGKPLSTQLKCRIYAHDCGLGLPKNCNYTYYELIHFLLFICAPRHKYSLTSNVVQPIIDAAQNSKKFFKELKESKDMSDEKLLEKYEDEANAIREKLKRESGGRGEIKDEEVAEELRSKKESSGIIGGLTTIAEKIWKAVSDDVRYNFTLHLESNLFTDKMKDHEVLTDWFIKSFSCTPSTEMVWYYNVPMPLWVDFEISLETCTVWPMEVIESKLRILKNN